MQLQDLLAIVKDVQGVNKWDIQSIIRVGGLLAVQVNSLQGLSGKEKTELVCSVVTLAMDESENKEKAEAGKTEEEKNAIGERYAKLRLAVRDALPASLELAVSAARGKVDLKKVKKSVWVQLFSCCADSAVSVLADAKLISEAQAKQVNAVLDAVEEKAMDVAKKADAVADVKLEVA